MLTLKDAVEFIRSKNGLSGWSDSEIAGEIGRAINDFAFTYSVDNQNKLDGVVVGRWDTKESLHIVYIAGNISFFMSFLKTNFPECKTITGYRSGVKMEYPTDNKLLTV